MDVSLLVLSSCFQFLFCVVLNIHKESINFGNKFTWILISRRGVYRAGTRLFCRGIDPNGNVANFVETEQMVIAGEQRTSFVQIRGSIPLKWSQYPNLRYKPSFKLNQSSPQIEPFGEHIRTITRLYGDICMVNLIGGNGGEGVLNTGFRDIVNQSNFQREDIPFVSLELFDFHKECKLGGWERLAQLMAQLEPYITRHQHLVVSSSGLVTRRQQGVIRTNCVDSLDRTNVVQSMIANSVLAEQLYECGVVEKGQRIQSFPSFYHVYRNGKLHWSHLLCHIHT